MPNANNRLSDYQAVHLQQALMLNPTTLYFPWNCADFPYATYPLGIPRASVLAAFKAKWDQDNTKGASYPVLYAPGIAVDVAGVGNFSAGATQVQTSFPGGTAQPAIAAANGGQALLQAAPVNLPAAGGTTSGSGNIVTQEAQVA